MALCSIWDTSKTGGSAGSSCCSSTYDRDPCDVSLAASSTGGNGVTGGVWSMLTVRSLLSGLGLPAASICWTR